MHKENMMAHRLFLSFLALAFSGCAATPSTPQQSMSASFYDIRDNSFSVQAVAPAQVIREYAICKTVWFAEKKNADMVALGDPKYGNPLKDIGSIGLEVPNGWVVVDATAFLSEAKATGNPFVKVSEMAKTCRAGWDWYR